MEIPDFYAQHTRLVVVSYVGQARAMSAPHPKIRRTHVRSCPDVGSYVGPDFGKKCQKWPKIGFLAILHFYTCFLPKTRKVPFLADFGLWRVPGARGAQGPPGRIRTRDLPGKLRYREKKRVFFCLFAPRPTFKQNRFFKTPRIIAGLRSRFGIKKWSIRAGGRGGTPGAPGARNPGFREMTHKCVFSRKSRFWAKIALFRPRRRFLRLWIRVILSALKLCFHQ